MFYFKFLLIYTIYSSCGCAACPVECINMD